MTAIFKKYMVKDHSSFFGGKPEIHFWFSKDPRHLATWARLLKRKGFKVNKNTTEACSNYFKFGRPVVQSYYTKPLRKIALKSAHKY